MGQPGDRPMNGVSFDPKARFSSNPHFAGRKVEEF